MKAVNPPIKLGEFLVATGLLSPSQITETMSMATNTGLPLGRALVLNNLITQKNLQAALRLQTIYRASKIPLAVAVNAYKHCVQDDLTPEQGLAKAGFARQIISYSKLGTLLVDAKIITKTQLDDAQKTSYETGVQLGRMLCFTGAISDEMLATALDLQSQMREQRINKDTALAELNRLYGQPAAKAKALPRPDLRLDASKSRGSADRKVKLGELLLMSGVINEFDVMDALEYSLAHSKTMADVLTDFNIVPANLIGIGAELQEAINCGDMTIESACESLNYIARTGERPEGQSDTNLPMDNSVKLGDILIVSDYVQQKDIEFAADLAKSFPSIIGKLLVTAGTIDEPTMRAALRCQSLVRQNDLTKEEAIKAMKHSGQRQISFDDALDELGLLNRK
ncbi:MAG: hypothetical protein JST89_24370 [Cyanobacteria bacterium SZAS-4]|nr:hypothetical protein [Cyanobacteria bacterium SZAS-4]